MSVFDRYLRTVEFWLPRAQRKDVIAELADDLRSQIEERESELGRALTDDEMKAFLDERGDPMTVAGRYLPPRYLIGPELFPIYRMVLKGVFLFYLVPALLVGGVLATFEVTPEITAGRVIEYAWTAAVYGFAIITAIFALLQRSPATRARLAGREAPRDPDRISRGEAVVEALGELVIVLFWGGLWALPVVEGVRVGLGPAARPFYAPVLLLLLASLALSVWNALRPRWTRQRALAALGINGLFLLVCCAMLAVRLFDVSLVSIVLPGVPAERVETVQKWANVFWSMVLFSVIIVTGVTTIFAALRVRRLSGEKTPAVSRNAAAAVMGVALALLSLVADASAQEAPDGAAIYRERCAGCHDAGAGRVPSFAALRTKTPAAVLASLERGPMAGMAAGLDSAERAAVVAYVTAPVAVDSGARRTAACGTDAAAFSLDDGGWSTWGGDAANSRFRSAREAGVRAEDVPRLAVKWAFSLGEVTDARGQPAVAGGRLFVGTTTGAVHALDAATGCAHWSFQAGAPVRGAVVVGPSAAGPSAYFGDQAGNVYAVDAATGALRWKRRPEAHPTAMITGAPQLHDGVLYVPVSSYEVAMAPAPGYQCCTFRGSVVALDAATGEVRWQTHTIAETPRPTTPGPTGVQRHGPSGVAVWSTPTIDPVRGVLYVGTGNNYSDPPTETSDAVLAMELRTGAIRWTRQLTAGDAYNSGCDFPGKPGCPAADGPDFDFGQPPILVALPGGRRALVIGQKSGMAHALDPDREGAVLWQARVSEGGKLGGSHWGSAADGERVYLAASDAQLAPYADPSSPLGFSLDVVPAAGGGLVALRLATGERAWSAAPVLACAGRRHCGPAQSAPVTAIDGVVFSGALDGHLRAYSAANGAVVWDFDTTRDFDTVNGGRARGGSLDVAGPVVAGGMVYVVSGYGQFGGTPGNVLLAFSVDGR